MCYRMSNRLVKVYSACCSNPPLVISSVDYFVLRNVLNVGIQQSFHDLAFKVLHKCLHNFLTVLSTLYSIQESK